MDCKIKRVITLTYPIRDVGVGVYDDNRTVITKDCEFSWSIDKVCWTPWVDYNQYIKILQNIDEEIYIRIRTCTARLGGVTKAGVICNDYTVIFDNTENVFTEDVCEDASRLDPYTGLDCALLLQQQLSDTVVCMLGIPIYYFKTDPKKETKDYTFKEYTLFGTDKVRHLKMMFPNGEMPSSEPQMEEMDFTFDVEWECELSKQQFAKAFGAKAFPNHRDYVYVPMQKRLYTVNSAYDEKNGGLLWQSPTWKISLVKYTENSNVDFGEEVEDLMNSIVVNNYKDVFELGERREQIATNTTTLQSPRFSATNVISTIFNDSVRSMVSKNITIGNEQINNKSLISAKSYYLFRDIEDMVSYQEQLCGDSGTVSFIATFPHYVGQLSTTILSIGEEAVILDADSSNKQYILKFSGVEVSIPMGSTQAISLSWSRSLHVHTINKYIYTYPTNIPSYAIKPTMMSFVKDEQVYVVPYNSDFIFTDKQQVILTGYPLKIHSLKVYDLYIGEGINDMFRYVSNNPGCIICDSVRELTDGHGYSVK